MSTYETLNKIILTLDELHHEIACDFSLSEDLDNDEVIAHNYLIALNDLESVKSKFELIKIKYHKFKSPDLKMMGDPHDTYKIEAPGR